jgi:hypothetical protein
MALEGYDFEGHNKNNPDDYQQEAINAVSEALQDATGAGADFITGLTNTNLETGMANFAAKLTDSEIAILKELSVDEEGNLVDSNGQFKELTGLDEASLKKLAERFGITLDDIINALINGANEVEQTAINTDKLTGLTVEQMT